MLNTFFSYFPGESAKKNLTCEPERRRALGELLAIVDQFFRLPPLKSYGDGIGGTHATLTVIDNGFILHAYFDEDGIGLEMYGPVVPGTEREHGDPYDGSGLWGAVDVPTLKEVLRLLDAGTSPREYVQTNGINVGVIED